MHGEGEMIWEDKRSFKGKYFNDKKHGNGVFTFEDGTIVEGIWDNGK